MILANTRNAFVRHSEDPGNGRPDEASMGDNQSATRLSMLRQLLQLVGCSYLQLEKRLASGRPMVGEELGPGPCVIWVLQLDFFPRQSFPVAEVHLPEVGRNLVAQAEMLRDRFCSFSCSPQVARPDCAWHYL